MAFDLSSARVRLGLAVSDVSKDEEIKLSLNVVLAAAENYCDRKFLQETEVAYYYEFSGKHILTKRYPITKVFEIRYDDAQKVFVPLIDKGLKVQHNIGKIILPHHLCNDPEVQVYFEGGYKILPPDLELALWGMFDATYATLNKSSSLPTGVSSISIPDVGTISFGGGSGNTAGGAAAHTELFGPYAMLLDVYRNKSC
jgi:hypothetical protein